MYCVISFSHKHLDISIRERIAFPQSELKQFYTKLFSSFSFIQECILLSTCNRFELLLVVNSKDVKSIVEWIASYRDISLSQLQSGVQLLFEDEALDHIFSVASSLDSLVLGETQITGQLKNAYKTSYEFGFCKKELTRAMHFAFKCAALIRSQTQISKSPTSVASVAIAHFLNLNPQKKKVVVVGTGEIGILCVKYLLSHGFEVLLLSRTLDHACAIKQELNDDRIDIASFANLTEIINSHPYLFCATGAPHAIITKDMIKTCSFQRIWFDLALPRDIQPLEEENIALFVIDDLQEVVVENKNKREEELQKARGMICQQVKLFRQWLASLDVEPLIKAFREKAKQCCIDEVSRAIKKGFLDSAEEEKVMRIMHNAFNKFLHHPTTYIKTIKENPESDFIVENIQKLFDLRGKEVFNNPYKCEKHLKYDEEGK
ncbi:glutamyl-tRNA reductase [Helicobacter kayseriensis]|uniref:glutamyl-tRNA reductase n=1 Tax=Helicobacter kayseriensis TaxID=2905877 RepID=UPI001E4A650B|nr:glutamyl-tRNA reductase [Helicobacter kayseriensis]MCE3046821.1 glutamyl-tRNA reductase [Helicobacter kayseriensis]MCE3047877.1 glutamyl-tRNA reductase [Helicobacter kayseriensis]